MSQRMDRVDELLRQEIGALLAKEVQDPRIGFATITDVETAPDLRHAKVWVSVIGAKAERDETIRALADAMPFIRHELGKRLRIRRIPDLHVRLDDTAERGTRVLHLLNELGSGTDPEAIVPFVESLPTPVKRLPHEGDLPEPDIADAVPAVHPEALDAVGTPGLPGAPGKKPAKRKPPYTPRGRGVARITGGRNPRPRR